MHEPLLTTKLYRPRLRPQIVPRPRLIAKLNQGLHQKLTLISAPAGFGKTTLVGEWISDLEGQARLAPSGATSDSLLHDPIRPPADELGVRLQAAWLSLDERDSDPKRFITYVIAALQTLTVSDAEMITSRIGQGLLALIQSPQPPPLDAILTMLLNEIAAVPDHVALVLDDYHLVDAPAIDQLLTFLLDHLPPQMHLVITTREDPPLPLPRLRVRGQLNELRASDLRFTLPETAVFLNKITGLELSEADIGALGKRTEGWIAGLQLAALSMQDREDVHGFVASFAGNDRYIVDYLVDEVLRRQPDVTRSFLLQTSILRRLNGPLCAAIRCTEANGPITAQDSGDLLEMLERSNLFVIPLDDQRNWYRYHHLFADVLLARLMKEQPEAIPGLHQRASIWFEQNEMTADAVRHAFAAGDTARAARIIELAWAKMDRNRQSTTWLNWARQLPDELLHNRPVLAVGFAWALLDSGELEAAEMRLLQAEQCLESSAEIVFANEEEFHYMPASIASARTYLSLALGDMPATVRFARQALALLPKNDYLRRGTPAALLGLAYWSEGNLVEAQQAFTDAMSNYQKAGNVLFVITGAYVLADMELAQGHLYKAYDTYQQALTIAQEHGKLVQRGAADIHTGLSELYLERNDLAAAKEHLLHSKKLGENAGLARWSFRWYLAQAKIKEAEGCLDEALDALAEAERHYIRGPVPDVRSTASMKTRIWVVQGRLHEAQQWAEAHDLAVDDELNYLNEYDHLTLARILIAQYRDTKIEHTIQGAMSLLERLLQAAEQGERRRSVLEILVLQSLAHEAQGDTASALGPLEQALSIAVPEGFVRLFIDNGAPMEQLLSTAAAQDILSDYTNKLLAELGAAQNKNRDKMQRSRSASDAAQSLVEPLSGRELEVLQLVAEGLSNREIAERLYLALSTVKGHNRNIYGKLQVNRRTEAVVRARELGLL